MLLPAASILCVKLTILIVSMGNRSSAQQVNEEQHHDHDWPEIEIDETRQEPVGSVLGHHNEVPVYSCSYKFLPVVSMLLWKGIQSHTEHGHYCGMKWQCVELARRYMIKTRSISFDSVGMAWEIFDLPHAFQVADPTLKFKFESHKNGSHERPKSGDLLIWRAGTASLVSLVEFHRFLVFLMCCSVFRLQAARKSAALVTSL
jgi:hypothetical protein